jgi:SAM-dependent MidA family methyltransferase
LLPDPALPQPSAEERAHSERLCELIRAEIDASGGAIPFRRYMELALYAPGLGYYMSGLRKFGVHGDFVTAPEISPLFSRCVARQCAQVLEHCAEPIILEAGAGSGVMAADVLLELQRLDRLPRRYLILELSGELRQRQRENIGARAPQLLARVDWLDRLPDARFEGVVLANELLDALPVQRVRFTGKDAVELYVRRQNDGFAWTTAALRDATLAARVAALASTLPDGYETEFNLAAEAWLRSLAPLLARGALLLIDYGFPAREFYHPQRTGGTLMCHYRHRTHTDPLILAGLQDITSHVDFSALAHTAHDEGLRVAGFTTQAYFLLALGIDRMVTDVNDDTARWRSAQQLQRLTSPAEMGELFKVLALSRLLDVELDGFQFVDQRARL